MEDQGSNWEIIVPVFSICRNASGLSIVEPKIGGFQSKHDTKEHLENLCDHSDKQSARRSSLFIYLCAFQDGKASHTLPAS